MSSHRDASATLSTRAASERDSDLRFRSAPPATLSGLTRAGVKYQFQAESYLRAEDVAQGVAVTRPDRYVIGIKSREIDIRHPLRED